MQNKVRKFVSFIFLLAFLIPTLGEYLHQFSHSNDFHCTEKSTHHFHALEHHCAICDFAFSSFLSDLVQPIVKSISFSIIPYASLNFSFHYIEETHSPLLRGPPVI